MLRLRADERLASRFEDGGAGTGGRLVVKSREALSRCEPVRVEISFGPLADEIVLAGRVEDVEEQLMGAPRITIQIAAEHRDRANYVRKVLSGARPAQARNYRRVPTDLAASWRHDGQRVASRIRDISRGGAFLVSRDVPAVGTRVFVEISDGLQLEGVVSWVRDRGRESGFGVCFKLRDREVAAELQRVVREQDR